MIEEDSQVENWVQAGERLVQVLAATVVRVAVDVEMAVTLGVGKMIDDTHPPRTESKSVGHH